MNLQKQLPNRLRIYPKPTEQPQMKTQSETKVLPENYSATPLNLWWFCFAFIPQIQRTVLFRPPLFLAEGRFVRRRFQRCRR